MIGAMQQLRWRQPEVSGRPEKRTGAATIRTTIKIASALILGSVLLVSFAAERYEPAGLVIAGCALAGLSWSAGWWPRKASLVLVLGADLLLVFLYLWSLDESIHVVIQATPRSYVARVGGDVVVLARPARAGAIGLYAGGMNDFVAKPTGEARMAGGTSPQAQLAELTRLGAPKSAWTAIRIVQPGHRPHDLSFSSSSRGAVSGSGWSRNPRGEWEGSPGSYAILAPTVPRSYTFSADLLRADGVQGVLVGLDGRGKGYLLAIRMDGNKALDSPYMSWLHWNGSSGYHGVIGTAIGHEQALPMIQRDLRIVLGSMMLALVLVALTVPFYALLLPLLSAARRSDQARLAGGAGQIVSPRAFDFVAALVAGAGLVLAALFATGVLGRIPHVQDESAFLFQAKTYALGRLWAPVPRLPAFFAKQHLLVYHGYWFSKFPPGWPVLLTVGVVLGAPWLVNPILAGAVLFLLYLIGREVYGHSVALLATILALSSPLLLILAGSYMAQTATLFYLSVFVYLLLRWSRRTQASAEAGSRLQRRDWQFLVPAGLFLGMALITHPVDSVAFSLPFAFLLWRRPAAFWLMAAAVPGLLVLLYNRALTGTFRLELYTLYWKFDHLGFGHHVGRHGFTIPQGLWNDGLRLEMLQLHLFGWPFYFALALPAIPFILGRANRWDVTFAVSALLVMGVYTAYWWPGIAYGPRYYYVALPWFCLLAARGVEELVRWPMRLPLRLPPNRLAALCAPLLLTLALLLYNVTFYLPAQIALLRSYNGVGPAPLESVQRANVHHALIFTVNWPPTNSAPYGNVFWANSPLLGGDIVYALDKGRADSELMRLDPSRSFYRLDRTKLKRLAQSTWSRRVSAADERGSSASDFTAHRR